MRFLLAFFLMLLGFASVGSAQTIKKAPRAGVTTCKNRCSVQYKFCKSRATSKSARKTCAATRKTCKGGCGG